MVNDVWNEVVTNEFNYWIQPQGHDYLLNRRYKYGKGRYLAYSLKV